MNKGKKKKKIEETELDNKKVIKPGEKKKQRRNMKKKNYMQIPLRQKKKLMKEFVGIPQKDKIFARLVQGLQAVGAILVWLMLM